jgi:MarR family transcriptional regulator, organic hydroperoxide resistance regulator
MSRPRMFQLLDRAAHVVRQQLERGARDDLGVSMVQAGALFHLAAHDGCRPSDLAAALAIQPAAATGLVDRMAEAGLVRRRPCPDDARAQRLAITARGRRIAERATPLVSQLQARLLAGFSPSELEIVARFLRHAAEVPLAAPLSPQPPQPSEENRP